MAQEAHTEKVENLGSPSLPLPQTQAIAAAITSTTTTTPAAPTATTSRTGTRGTGSGAAPGGGAASSDAQDIRDAFDAALHRTGPGPPSGGGPGGPRGPGGGPGGPRGPRGGAPTPILLAHLVPIPANPDVRVMGSLPCIFDGDRQQADAFINELLTYIHVNIGVPGFESPMRKIVTA